MISASPGTIVVYSDIACPWSHLAVHRLWSTRALLDLEDEVCFDHRAFPLEIFNERATPKRVLDAELPVVAGLDPSAGWHTWDRPEWEYPGSSLLALEAVQAAKRQGLRAGEELDRALRWAFFRDRRNITMRHEVAAAAEGCANVDAALLMKDLDAGLARHEVMEQKALGESDAIEGSPHLFLPDGSGEHNPGIELHWDPGGFPVIDKDNPSIYEDLLRRATNKGGADG